MSSCKVPVILIRFGWNLNFRDKYLKKSSDVKFNENPSNGSRIVSCGQTDGNGEANFSSSQFSNVFKNESTGSDQGHFSWKIISLY